MSLMKAVYTVHEKITEKPKRVDGACLSHWRWHYQEYIPGLVLHPRSSFPESNLENFKETLRILREIMPVKYKIPLLKYAKDIWEKDKWNMTRERYSNMEIYLIFCVLRYPQEQPDRWKTYKILWNTGRYTSRYLCYVTSMLGNIVQGRTGLIHQPGKCIGGGHNEFTYNTRYILFPQFKKDIAEWRNNDSSFSWGKCHKWSDRLGSGNKTICSLGNHMDFNLYNICDELHQVNGFEVKQQEKEAA